MNSYLQISDVQAGLAALRRGGACVVSLGPSRFRGPQGFPLAALEGLTALTRLVGCSGSANRRSAVASTRGSAWWAWPLWASRCRRVCPQTPAFTLPTSPQGRGGVLAHSHETAHMCCSPRFPPPQDLREAGRKQGRWEDLARAPALAELFVESAEETAGSMAVLARLQVSGAADTTRGVPHQQRTCNLPTPLPCSQSGENDPEQSAATVTPPTTPPTHTPPPPPPAAALPLADRSTSPCSTWATLQPIGTGRRRARCRRCHASASWRAPLPCRLAAVLLHCAALRAVAAVACLRVAELLFSETLHRETLPRLQGRSPSSQRRLRGM